MDVINAIGLLIGVIAAVFSVYVNVYLLTFVDKLLKENDKLASIIVHGAGCGDGK